MSSLASTAAAGVNGTRGSPADALLLPQVAHTTYPRAVSPQQRPPPPPPTTPPLPSVKQHSSDEAEARAIIAAPLFNRGRRISVDAPSNASGYGESDINVVGPRGDGERPRSRGAQSWSPLQPCAGATTTAEQVAARGAGKSTTSSPVCLEPIATAGTSIVAAPARTRAVDADPTAAAAAAHDDSKCRSVSSGGGGACLDTCETVSLIELLARASSQSPRADATASPRVLGATPTTTTEPPCLRWCSASRPTASATAACGPPPQCSAPPPQLTSRSAAAPLSSSCGEGTLLSAAAGGGDREDDEGGAVLRLSVPSVSLCGSRRSGSSVFFNTPLPSSHTRAAPALLSDSATAESSSALLDSFRAVLSPCPSSIAPAFSLVPCPAAAAASTQLAQQRWRGQVRARSSASSPAQGASTDGVQGASSRFLAHPTHLLGCSREGSTVMGRGDAWEEAPRGASSSAKSDVTSVAVRSAWEPRAGAPHPTLYAASARDEALGGRVGDAPSGGRGEPPSASLASPSSLPATALVAAWAPPAALSCRSPLSAWKSPRLGAAAAAAGTHSTSPLYATPTTASTSRGTPGASHSASSPAARRPAVVTRDDVAAGDARYALSGCLDAALPHHHSIVPASPTGIVCNEGGAPTPTSHSHGRLPPPAAWRTSSASLPAHAAAAARPCVRLSPSTPLATPREAAAADAGDAMRSPCFTPPPPPPPASSSLSLLSRRTSARWAADFTRPPRSSAAGGRSPASPDASLPSFSSWAPSPCTSPAAVTTTTTTAAAAAAAARRDGGTPLPLALQPHASVSDVSLLCFGVEPELCGLQGSALGCSAAAAPPPHVSTDPLSPYSLRAAGGATFCHGVVSPHAPPAPGQRCLGGGDRPRSQDTDFTCTDTPTAALMRLAPPPPLEALPSANLDSAVSSPQWRTPAALADARDDAYPQSPATQFRCAFSSLRGCRSRQEDSILMATDMPVAVADDTDVITLACLGVFDGHCGDTVASLASQHLPPHLETAVRTHVQQSRRDRHGGETESCGAPLLLGAAEVQGAVSAALVQALVHLDLTLYDALYRSPVAGGGRHRHAGSTACVATFFKPLSCPDGAYRLSIANLGDSRAIVGSLQTGEVLLCTTDHRILVCPAEADRITAAGGVVALHRVDGSLDVTRGLGDYRYKTEPSLWWGRPSTSTVAGDAAAAAAASVATAAPPVANAGDVDSLAATPPTPRRLSESPPPSHDDDPSTARVLQWESRPTTPLRHTGTERRAASCETNSSGGCADGPPTTTTATAAAAAAAAAAPVLTANAVSNIADVYEWKARRGDVLVIASDGVWDRMTAAEVMEFICAELDGLATAPSVSVEDAAAPEHTPVRQCSMSVRECALASGGRHRPAAGVASFSHDEVLGGDDNVDGGGGGASGSASVTGSASRYSAVSLAASRLAEHVVYTLAGSDNTSVVVVTFD
ncbi:Protein phosphatase 2C [Novymonas esmeraldas]|uniref:protein-serine/threonine phosphatase n=1 Tax=Novymonas esmeraldas TaxID=1808958 RepID=A0AAW0F5Z4_9TRYP